MAGAETLERTRAASPWTAAAEAAGRKKQAIQGRVSYPLRAKS